MTKERQICVRLILDKLVSLIYRCVGYIVILAILVFSCIRIIKNTIT